MANLTTNSIPKATGSTQVDDSLFTDDGTTPKYNGVQIVPRKTLSPAYAASITIDAAGPNDLIVNVGTLTGNLTLANPTSPTAGQRIEIVLKQDGSGNHTLTLGNAFRFPSSSTLTSPISSSNSSIYATAGGKTRMIVEYDGADSKWDVVAFVPGYGL